MFVSKKHKHYEFLKWLAYLSFRFEVYWQVQRTWQSNSLTNHKEITLKKHFEYWEVSHKALELINFFNQWKYWFQTYKYKIE